MTVASGFDMGKASQGPDQSPKAEVLLGEDWVTPETDSDGFATPRRAGVAHLNRSPLARKIITFNLVGLILLVAGVLYLNPFRDSLVIQHERVKRDVSLAAEV